MSNDMEKYKVVEHKRGSNPIQVFNEKFSTIDICKRTKLFSATKGKDIEKSNGGEAFEYDGKNFVTKIDKWGYDKGDVYSPFQLLSILRFKDNWGAALKFCEMEYMNKECPYVRVGTDYFLRLSKENEWGVVCKKLKPWKKEEIKEDHPNKDIFNNIPKFPDYTIKPNNENYQSSVDGMWNLYEPFPHEASDDPVTVDDIPASATFISHVFGEQAELGWQYMKVLFERPKQILPVLVLVSDKADTGKTSFINWLNMIFGNNYVKIPPADLKQSFNSHFAYKNIIAIDEAVVDKRTAVERIKSLATARNITVNQKMVSQYNIPFYGKIVMTTNKETDFMRIRSEEIRFWVRKLDPIPGDEWNENLYEDLLNEIPKLLAYLQQNIEVEYGRSRMVFPYKEIHNEFTEAVKKESRSNLHKNIEHEVQEWFIEHKSQDQLNMRVKDIKKHWFEYDNKYDSYYISKVLRNELEMESQNGEHHIFGTSGPKERGRAYTFKREDFVEEEATKTDQPPF